MMKKYLALILSASAVASAADFVTGQAARAVFGQQTFTALDIETPCVAPNTINCLPPTPYVLGGSAGVAYANDTLFVADANRIGASPALHRVLIYTNISQSLPKPADPVVPPSGPNFVRCPLCLGSSLTPLNTLILGTPDYTNYGITATSFRTPTAIATNGTILAVADTDNNRILIWNSIPTSSGQAADIVLGQADFKTVKPPTTVDAKSFRAPQGVWIQGTRFFVADTANNRVMVWNNIPTSSNQAADYVLGVPNFTTAPQPDLTKNTVPAAANNMASPVSVTSDGTRLFVADLGNNRVLIWNSIPTQTQQPADIAIGQTGMTTSADNYSFTGVPATSATDTTNKETPVLCAAAVPNGNDLAGNPTFPTRCAATLSFPRFALSDGQRLFIADGGNDRILVFNTMPGQSGQRADVILGQPDEFSDNITDQDSSFVVDANIGRSASDTLRTPMSLAWDGTNLYVADPFDRRVMVFTPGSPIVPLSGIVNAASRNVAAIASVSVSGTITAGDIATVSIGVSGGTPVDYKYTIVKDDTLTTVINNLVKLINANNGDPNVLAIADIGVANIVLTARLPGAQGNNITLAVSTTGVGTTTTTTVAATIVLSASGGTLTRGGSAAEVAPGTIVSIFADSGASLADHTVSADPNATGLPNTLGGVQVYFNGQRVPLSYVSPNQINAQMPFEMLDTSSVSAYVRTSHDDGTVTFTSAVNVPIVLDNPGIFAFDGPEPRQAMAYHGSSYALAVVDLEGSAQAGDTASITIDGREYDYAVQSTDTLGSIRDGLVTVINATTEERVTASAAGQYNRVILTAKVPGPDGNGIVIGSASTSTVKTGALVTLTALETATCCASIAGAPITNDNPATPGELITIYATGLGVIGPDAAKNVAATGSVYPLSGPPNTPNAPVDDAQVGGRTATVLFSGLKPGLIGVYEVKMQLDSGVGTDYNTQMFIAQDIFTSNIVTIPVVAPVAPQSAPPASQSATRSRRPHLPQHRAPDRKGRVSVTPVSEPRA
jgi:uncharacterized protein (TIGR03437 family)